MKFEKLSVGASKVNDLKTVYEICSTEYTKIIANMLFFAEMNRLLGKNYRIQQTETNKRTKSTYISMFRCCVCIDSINSSKTNKSES